MVAPVFRESAFVWACVLMLSVCALAALAAWQRKFLLGLSEQFVRLPPSGKAVIATAAALATVFAQKPGDVSTDFTDLHGLEDGASTNLRESARAEVTMPSASNTCAEETQSVSEGRSQSDSERSELPARAREETEEGRHGGDSKKSLDRIDKIVEVSASRPPNPANPVTKTPCLRFSNTSVFSAAGLSMSSESNAPITSFTLLSTFQTFSKPSKLPRPSKPFTRQVTPSGLCGAFTWTNVCCRVSGI